MSCAVLIYGIPNEGPIFVWHIHSIANKKSHKACMLVHSDETLPIKLSE